MSVEIEMYTTAACPYCVAAKNWLVSRGYTYREIRIDQDVVRRDEMLIRSGQRRTVPQIFINQRHVGGYDDLVALERSGLWDQWIQGASPADSSQ